MCGCRHDNQHPPTYSLSQTLLAFALLVIYNVAKNTACNSSVTSLLRSISFHNLTISDEAMVDFLLLFDGVPVNSIVLDGVTLIGEGR